MPLNVLNTDSIAKVKYLLANALQINAAFSTARKQVEQQSLQSFYVPYEPLSNNIQDGYLLNITTLLKESKTDECVSKIFSIYFLLIINY